jgi:carboxypeptidase T
MKKCTIAFSIILIVLLVVPSTNAASLLTPLEKSIVLKMVREQRLAEIQNNLPIITTSGLYHNYDEMTVLLHTLAANYSDIMSLTSIGKTYEGRDLWMVKLSDHVDEDEDEPEVFFMGAHHGNEKPSYEVLIFFIQFIVDNYENGTGDVREAINNTELFIIPMVNPDGVEAGTRKNCAPNHGPFGLQKKVTSIGVDLNRNYGYRWFLFFLFPWRYYRTTSLTDRSNAYRGEYPFCENETQAIKSFIETHNITISLSYHSYGELVLYPWGYTKNPPKDKPVFVSIGENISKLDNYTLTQSINLYPTIGDDCDWGYGYHGIFCYTIELGTVEATSDPQDLLEMCTAHVNVNLYVCQRAQLLQKK